VRTCCHPEVDCIAVSIDADDPGIVIEFPFGSPNVNAADWQSPAKTYEHAQRHSH